MDERNFDHLENLLKQVRHKFDKELAEVEKELSRVRKRPTPQKPTDYLEARKTRMKVLKRDHPEVAEILEEWEAKYGLSVPIQPPTPTVPVAKAGKFLQDFLDE